MLLGILSGIFIRTNDVLSIRSSNMASHFRSLGFTDVQVSLIMDQLALQPVSWYQHAQGSSSLLSSEQAANLKDLRASLGDDGFVEHLSQVEPYKKQILELRKKGLPSSQIADAIIQPRE